MHVTQVYSREPVSLNVLGGEVTADGGPRSIAPLGDKGAVVLHFVSDELAARHKEAIRSRRQPRLAKIPHPRHAQL